VTDFRETHHLCAAFTLWAASKSSEPFYRRRVGDDYEIEKSRFPAFFIKRIMVTGSAEEQQSMKCPAVSSLVKYSEGVLSSELKLEVENHLKNCKQCAVILQRIKERVLVEAVMACRSEKYAELWGLFRGRLNGWIGNLVPQSHFLFQDCLEDAYFELFDALKKKKLVDSEKFAGYAKHTVYNYIYDERRKAKRRKTHPLDDNSVSVLQLQSEALSPEDQIEGKDSLERISNMLDADRRFDAIEKQIVKLVFLLPEEARKEPREVAAIATLNVSLYKVYNTLKKFIRYYKKKISSLL